MRIPHDFISGLFIGQFIHFDSQKHAEKNICFYKSKDFPCFSTTFFEYNESSPPPVNESFRVLRSSTCPRNEEFVSSRILKNERNNKNFFGGLILKCDFLKVGFLKFWFGKSLEKLLIKLRIFTVEKLRCWMTIFCFSAVWIVLT